MNSWRLLTNRLEAVSNLREAISIELSAIKVSCLFRLRTSGRGAGLSGSSAALSNLRYLQQSWKYQGPQKPCDIIGASYYSDCGGICYVFQPFKYLNC
jgi:hypothetical protein